MPHSFANGEAALRAVPVTLSLIALSVVGFLLVYLNAPVSWLSNLTFSDFRLNGKQLSFVATQGEYWRLLTPIFLHFGWLHITFNSLWLWELGALLEQRMGSLLLAVLVVVCGVGSNLAQYLYSGPSLFGGMSGVVYALLGFCWVYNALQPARGLSIPRAIVVFMVVWLLFCMLMPTQQLGIGAVANAAHLGGLLLGCGSALITALWQRLQGN